MSVKCLDLSGFSYFWSQFKESDYWNKINANDISATLTTSWTGASAPYTQNVSVSGLLATDPIDVGLADAVSGTEYESAAKAQLHCTSQTAGQITVTAFGEKPTIAIPIVVRVFTRVGE